MSIWGKIIGGVSGLAIGGPIGALIGVAVGSVVDTTVQAVLDPEAKRQITFTMGVIALSAKMAKADGRVTREEVDAFKRVFQVPDNEVANVGRFFDLARQSTAGFQSYAKQVADLLSDSPEVLEDLLEGLFHIAEADGHVHPMELAFLQEVASIFGFRGQAWEDIRARHVGPDAKNPYTILGVKHDVSDAELRKHYKSLVKEHHPDRLMAEGVPSDLISVATDRLASINHAYDEIIKLRDVKQGI